MFTVGGIIVDIDRKGKEKGMDEERSGLLLSFEALLQELPEPASELEVRVDISFVIKTRYLL